MNIKKSWNPFEQPSSFQYQLAEEEIFDSPFTKIPSIDNSNKSF